MKNLLLCTTLLLLFSCNEATQSSDDSSTETADNTEANITLGTKEYVDLHEQSINYLADKNIEAWAAMLADDMEYHFPDGDLDTRTILKGKDAVVAWWTDWAENSGVQSMSFTNPTYLPVHAKEASAATGVSGNFVISYFSNTMELENGNTVKLRMNMNTHINDSMKIDRVYSYYDRTPIIQAMGGNILDTE